MSKKSSTESTAIATTEAPAPETTALATLESSKFLALRPDSELAEAMAYNYANGETVRFSDLIRVKTPSGGSTKWSVEELTGEEMVDEIIGAVVYYHPAGTLWPTDELSEGAKPLLRTRDLITAEQFGEDYGDLDPDKIEEARLFDANGEPVSTADGRGVYDWTKLYYNQWGTGKNGVGKRCKESRQLCILREGDQFPLYLQVQVGSLKDVTGFFRKLPGAYFNFVVGFSLEKAKSSGGITFSKIKPRLVTKLSRPEALQLKSIYTDRLRGAMDEAIVADADSFVADDAAF